MISDGDPCKEPSIKLSRCLSMIFACNSFGKGISADDCRLYLSGGVGGQELLPGFMVVVFVRKLDETITGD